MVAANRSSRRPAGLKDDGILAGRFVVSAKDRRFRRLLSDAVRRPPGDAKKISSVRSVVLSNHPVKMTAGLTRYSDVKLLMLFSHPRQTITFYAELLNALSDKAAEAVIAHELAHAWLNEHLRPEESQAREEEADDLARRWGFGEELDALDHEAETVNSSGKT
ncbi:MAG: M48 family metalloprotease [Thaumarchaeota archaeon]|nr:M48 family metalloprotease [Nitrososphaerota archaeon]